MGVKNLIIFFVLLFVIGCSIGNKTKPVVTDINNEPATPTGNVIAEVEKPAQETAQENQTETKEITPEAEEETQEEPETEEQPKEELAPGTYEVIIKDLKLEPKELTIKQGETVVWKHQDKYEQEESTKHYIVAHYNKFRSPILYYGDTFKHTFNETGTYTYIDAIYKDKENLRGKIIVVP